jgi:hypothetical protein
MSSSDGVRCSLNARNAGTASHGVAASTPAVIDEAMTTRMLESQERARRMAS